MRSRTRLALRFVVIAGASVVYGCGDSSGPAERSAPPATAFPSAKGKTLEQVISKADGAARVVVSPTGMVYRRGVNRYGFGVFTLGREQVTNADVALYFAHGAAGKARGPYPARFENLVTKPAFRARTTAADPDAATGVYVVPKVRLDMNGEWRVVALVKIGDRLGATRLPSAVVGQPPAEKATLGGGEPRAPPSAGQQAPRMHTPTAAEVGGDLSKIDTRVPPDDMHDIDFAEVLGNRPIVLLFATPQLCVSRVCGPVVDIAEEVKQEFGDQAAFVHMEIFKDNDPNKGVRPQVSAFRLPTEPWLFVIDRRGVIRTAIEGAFSADELREALRRVAE